jgi:hypothetical protein
VGSPQNPGEHSAPGSLSQPPVKNRLANNKETTPTNLVQTEDLQQNANFASDMPPQEKRMMLMRELDSGLLKSVREDRTHSLIDFLSRPTRLAEGVWATTDVAGTELFRLDVPEDAILSDMYAEKMEGFLGFRAKAVIRVQINAQRYQQGRLLMHYFPQGQVNTIRRSVAEQSLTLRTQLPRVELDCATSTEAILEMPYVSPTTHYNLISGTGPIGAFMMCVYSPLLVGGGGSNTVHWSAWIHFEDVDLSFPTITNMETLQNSIRQGVVFEAQGGIKKNPPRGREGKPPETVEKATMAQTPLAFALSRVAKASTVMGEIPLLSSIARSVTWAADLATHVASAFGWSNPRSGDASTRVVGQRFPHGHNIDGLDQSVSLGLSAENKLEDLPGFAGTDIDEMAYDYVKEIPSYITTFQWALADAADDDIWSDQIGPAYAFSSRNVTTNAAALAVRDYAPFAYASRFFQFWRGSITYTFKIIKTEFHSGRLLVSFRPGSAVVPTAVNRNYLYREIIDIRLTNEFKVTIPYVNTIPWTKADDPTGLICIQVLNPLVAPDTVESHVDILVEMNAGPDFQIAVPNTLPNQLPVLTIPGLGLKRNLSSLKTEKKYRYDKNTVFVAQGGEGTVEAERTATVQTKVEPIASSDINSGGLSSSRFCIGEVFTSFKQLMHRHICWRNLKGINGATVLIRPGAMEVGYVNSGFAPVPTFFSLDYTSIFGSMYAYRRGGMRVRFHQMPNASASALVGEMDRTYTAHYVSDTSTVNGAVSTTEISSHCSAMVIARDQATGGLEIELPHYGRVHTYLNWCDLADPLTADSIYRDRNAVWFSSLNNFSGSAPAIFRQTSDETHFGFFVGVLPLTTDTRIVTNGNPFFDY